MRASARDAARLHVLELESQRLASDAPAAAGAAVANSASAAGSQACVEFLHIMKEFSESSCDASEAAQRVDSLVSQDAALLRLFPLSRRDEASSSGHNTPGSHSVAHGVHAVAAVAASPLLAPQVGPDQELQRWIELDLELDHRMDVLDFQHEQQHLHISAAPIKGKPVSTVSTVSSVPGSGFVPPKSFMASLKASRAAAPPALDKRSALAAALLDENEDGELLLDAPPALKRQRLAAGHALLRTVNGSRAADTGGESKAEEDESIVWGMESDGYERDLLSSIDHAALCDRENRFLQWDLEMEAQHQHALQQQLQPQQHALSSPAMFSALNGARPPAVSTGGRVDSVPTVTSASAATATAAHKKLAMASSPRERMSKSPSNVDIVEDWNSIDFGTFQNRTVSHILSSCLHKRKLHHPYKNQVQLVNFTVPGDSNGTSSALAQAQQQQHAHHQLGGSLASSLAFGGQNHDVGADGGLGNAGALGAFVPMLVGADAAKGALKGDKKPPKKRDERKRLMSLKMQETFADLEGTFTEQDLDVKGIVGPGGAALSKMALSKLENLPLPDLTNLPQDLRELKRKIEATEHKVEGTKHRHRKGGPCPRCQVQNQLRAAKRAYHKRAVAHKKLPHVAAAVAAAEAGNDAPSSGDTSGSSSVLASDGAKNGTGGSPATNGAVKKPEAAATTTAVPASVAASAMAKAATVKSVGVSANGVAKAAAVPPRAPTAALHLSDGAGRAMAASLLASSPSLSPLAGPVAAVAPSPLNAPVVAGVAAAQASAAFQARATRPCGNPALQTPFSSPSSSVAPPSSSSSPSSPETASPPIQHVTVSSA